MADLKNQPKSFWRDKLDDMQFKVTREAATEAPFTGKYWNHKEAGEYKCVCCGTPLFESVAKYDSGCGWPSFYMAKENKPGDVIEERPDSSHGMNRVEVLCKTCGAHLGHIFEDGPQPTGMRYCINSASLDFTPKR